MGHPIGSMVLCSHCYMRSSTWDRPVGIKASYHMGGRYVVTKSEYKHPSFPHWKDVVKLGPTFVIRYLPPRVVPKFGRKYSSVCRQSCGTLSSKLREGALVHLNSRKSLKVYSLRSRHRRFIPPVTPCEPDCGQVVCASLSRKTSNSEKLLNILSKLVHIGYDKIVEILRSGCHFLSRRNAGITTRKR